MSGGQYIHPVPIPPKEIERSFTERAGDLERYLKWRRDHEEKKVALLESFKEGERLVKALGSDPLDGLAT